MDDDLFQRHLRLTRLQFEELNIHLNPEDSSDYHARCQDVPPEMKTVIFLWYMANQNSFREISDKFNISQSTAHDIISVMLRRICRLAAQFIRWPSPCEKIASMVAFRNIMKRNDIIGAIDGCHIRIQRPSQQGLDYMNRKGYFSILLQGICNHEGRFMDVFVGPPGRVHDARMLRESPFFSDHQERMGGTFLLGDTAYLAQDFNFILTPKRDNGRLTDTEIHDNMLLSRARVIIENAFGRMKCRWRRLRDLQNVRLDIIVQIVLAACTLHNICLGDSPCCEHPGGCPRDQDENE